MDDIIKQVPVFDFVIYSDHFKKKNEYFTVLNKYIRYF